MTKRELNRDIKRLAAKYTSLTAQTNNNEMSLDEYSRHLDTLREEVRTLYFADDTLTSLTAQTLRTLLALNVTLRAVPFHVFGSNIDLG